MLVLSNLGLATLKEVPAECPAIYAVLGGAPKTRRLVGEYNYIAHGTLDADADELAKELSPLLPDVNQRELSNIIARAIENGVQHGRHGRGYGYFEVGIVYDEKTISVFVLNPIYSWGLSQKMMHRVFRPGDSIHLEDVDRDMSRGASGVGVILMARSLHNLFHRNSSSTMQWEQLDLDVEGFSNSPRWVKFTLTMPRKMTGGSP